jgi:hypothetical protein
MPARGNGCKKFVDDHSGVELMPPNIDYSANIFKGKLGLYENQEG